MKLALPDGPTRPTQNRARIALFNILNEILPATSTRHQPLITVWDAFAGSGAFGLECVSRGWANRAIFTDTAPESVRAIKLNARGFDGAAAEIVIQRRDAIAAAAEYGAAADLVFMDPPYANPTLGAQLLEKLAAAAKPGTIIVWEMEKEPSVSGKFEILKDKIYGRARFVIMRKLPPPKSC
ncbi:MAG: RsmD family RNA methyltransferase [Proteobacteria bacterium]|nr:RsmD family RNA methyltransferase [Pseudomonadota bacterium]